MTSYELSQELSRLLDILNEENELIVLLAEMASLYEDVIPIVSKILAVDSSSKTSSFYGDVEPRQIEIRRVVSKIQAKRPAKTLIMLDQLVGALERLTDRRDLNALLALKTKIEKFYAVFEETINNYTWPQTVGLLVVAQDLHNSILFYRDLVTLIKEDLQPTIDVPENNEIASLVFQSPTEYEEFLNKLIALDRLYSELCLLAGVSKSQFPLRAIKIETGSLWIKIFGESRVITLLTSLIESAANYFYRNFTDEGKVTSIPRSVEAIESVLDLTKKLEAQGIDVSSSKDNLQKAAVIMSAQLNALLLKEPSIEVNGVNYSVSESMQDKYLLDGQRLLEDGKSSDH